MLNSLIVFGNGIGKNCPPIRARSSFSLFLVLSNHVRLQTEEAEAPYSYCVGRVPFAWGKTCTLKASDNSRHGDALQELYQATPFFSSTTLVLGTVT